MRTVCAILLTTFVSIVAFRKSYEGYRAYRIYPKNDEQVYLINLLRHNKDFDFWSEASVFGKPTDIMVKPERVNFFETLMYNNHFNATIKVHNVETTLPKPSYLAFRSLDSPDGSISFKKFERYDTIKTYLKSITSEYPNIATLISLGKSTENRDLLGLKLSTGGSNKPAIVVDAGIHAREWIAPSMALYIIDQLVSNPSLKDLINMVDWYIIPLFNPDGYEYTHTKDRFWRKTRSPHNRCKGADANRNFNVHWSETGTSHNECDETYGGPRAFSEAETRRFRNFIYSINAGKTIKMYLTLHSYGKYILYPWGWTVKDPKNKNELQTLAESAAKAIRAVRGTNYSIGATGGLLYPAAGGSDDWMMSKQGVPLVYTMELPEGGESGFDPPASAIKGIVEETFEGIKVFGRYVQLKYGEE